MKEFLIRGGNPLYGTIRIHGAKNSALPILAAAAVTGSQCRICNCPDITDVTTALEILTALGAKTSFTDGTVTVDAKDICQSEIPAELMRKMRSSVIFLGALLARFGECTLTSPGGCLLGARPINLHLSAMEQMGAEIRQEGEHIRATACSLHGCTISLPTPSVGATENIMLAAMGCPDTVTLCNAAKEPEICDLAEFLNTAGAQISGAGSGILHIRGQRLHGCTYSVMPDRIEAATYLSAAACAGGSLTLTHCRPAHFRPVLELYAAAGCGIAEYPEAVSITAGALQAVSPIKTAPYPGFPTDAQALAMAAMTCAEGISVFVETVFSERYRHTDALRQMGADIHVGKRIAVVQGVMKLHGAKIEATDLRGGAAMVCAALGAEGESRLTGLAHIDRGYEALEYHLRQAGAKLTLTETEES